MCVPSSFRRRLTSIGAGVALVAGLLAVSSEASAQPHFNVLHAFPPQGPVRPNDALVQATDGNFYGTTQNGGTQNSGTVFKITPTGTFTLLHSFNFNEGTNPLAGLIQATDGNLYGTTQNGGNSGLGTVYQITTTGTLTVLHSFISSDGTRPVSGLVQATDGNLYGVTRSGGTSGVGTVFKTTTTGTFTLLHSFNYPSEGGQPPGRLIQATDGNLYGTAQIGGASFAGTVFQITTAGTLTVLHSFNGSTEGFNPQAGLVQASDGNLYGTTGSGGTGGVGTFFKITTTGTLTLLHAFNAPPEGGGPAGSLVQATDGNLYGTAQFGGASGSGTVFQLTTTGTLTVLHAFSGGADGAQPRGALIQATDGNLWATTQSGGPSSAGTIFKVTLTGTETVVFAFNGGAEGTSPRGLVQLTDGNLYGTTVSGGASGSGTVFRLTPTTSAFTNLHSLVGGEGSSPAGTLARATDGNLYGTAQFGGTSGSGTVFQITPSGTLTVLHGFNFSTDGSNLQGGLVQATDGNLYGTAQNGGPSGAGTIFKITTTGTLTVLHNFTFDGTDGYFPTAALIQATDGNLYGTTNSGGASGQGTVFKITTAGTYTVLHEFANDGADGAFPLAGLIQATDGNLYGTTQGGGAQLSGTVFKMTLGGTLTVIHEFNFTEGSNPAAGLIQAADGNLYGTAQNGGPRGRGTVFKITPSGTLTVLKAFSGGADGSNPFAGVIQGTDGNFYGTTSSGGATNNGVVFRIGAGVTVRDDYDGDGKADLIVYRPSSSGAGQFFLGQSSSGYSPIASVTFGFGVSSADTPVTGDFDGDGRMDLAVYRRTTGQWLISLSSTNFSGVSTFTWGRSNDVPVPGDYDGDGKADVAVFRPSTGKWFVLLSSTNNSMFATYSWGIRGDTPVPGDYDGDGKTDLAVYRRSTGQWWIFKSSNGTVANYQWGASTDLPVQGDYDGDGKADIAVFRPSTGQWLILTSGSGYTASTAYTWGASTDILVPADYDGDGRIDLAIFRPSTGQWFIAFSRTGYSTSAVYYLGASTDIPAAGITAVNVAGITDTTRASDFDRDQKADLAVFRPSTGQWLIDLSGANYTTSAGYSWGVSTDIPAPGDYDGDGKADLAVFRPSTGQWLIALSSTNYSTSAAYNWGASTDIPVPGDYDGDGRTDLAVFRPSTGQWLISLSSTNYAASVAYTLGVSTDKLVPGDYDGDGKTDLAVYRNGQWLMMLSSANYASVVSRTWGNNTDVAVPGDYDGDGLTDLAVYRASTGQWYVLQSSTGYTTYASYSWGAGSGYVAVPADYDGDGKTDLAVFQPSTGQWWVLTSGSGYATYFVDTWGTSTDIPLVRRQ